MVWHGLKLGGITGMARLAPPLPHSVTVTSLILLDGSLETFWITTPGLEIFTTLPYVVQLNDSRNVQELGICLSPDVQTQCSTSYIQTLFVWVIITIKINLDNINVRVKVVHCEIDKILT